jgi:hypothetical protein
MIDFRIYAKQFDSVLYVYGERDEIQIDPPYQRMSDIWPEERRQLLVDSILNEFDIPKIYFHEFPKPRKIKGHIYSYAIIDGKQRLESIWGFIGGRFALAKDFQYFHDDTVDAGGMTYSDLAIRYPRLKSRFDATSLPIVLIQTDDTDLIEDMFSRLNEAAPLNAAEKRNALGGPLPKAIRTVSSHSFFLQKLPYTNTRYRHYDLAAKYLYIEQKDGFSDTKKTYLDEFVRSFKGQSESRVHRLTQETKNVLDRMATLFRNKDPLVASVGMSVLYYLLVRDAIEEDWFTRLSRDDFVKFEQARVRNRTVAEKDISKANYQLLEFDRFSNWLNDEVPMKFRLEVLRNHVDRTIRKR